jgi:hypothetical protein
LFHLSWERKQLPDPGAQNYAFESYGLVAFPPSGPSVTTRQPVVPLPLGPQMYSWQGVRLDGIPLVAGQIHGQPLFDPQLPGFTEGLPPQISPLVPYNVPASSPDYPAAMQPNITDRTRLRAGP